MDFRKTIIRLTLVLLLVNGAAVAGPDRTTSLFMNTTASLFDLGMYKLDIRLNNISFINVGFEESLPAPIPSASYIWDNDKIIIMLSYFKPYGPKDDKAYARKSCLSAFSNLRIDALVNPQTGELYDFTPTTRWAKLFSHADYNQGGVENELVNLDNKFILSCSWVFNNDSLGTLVIEAPLLSKSYSEKILK